MGVGEGQGRRVRRINPKNRTACGDLAPPPNRKKVKRIRVSCALFSKRHPDFRQDVDGVAGRIAFGEYVKSLTSQEFEENLLVAIRVRFQSRNGLQIMDETVSDFVEFPDFF